MNSIGLFEMLRDRILKEESYGPRTSMSYLFAVFFGSDAQGLQRFASVTQALEDAKAFENVVFTYCPSDSLISKFHAQDGAVVLFTDFDEGRFDLPAGFSESELSEFLETYAWPLVTKLTEATAPSIRGRNLPCLYVFTKPVVSSQECQGDISLSLEDAQLARDFLEKTLQVIGQMFRGALQVVLVDDIEEPASATLAKALGVSATDFPMACVVELEAPFNQYRSAEMWGAVSLMAFVQSWDAGWLEPFSP